MKTLNEIINEHKRKYEKPHMIDGIEVFTTLQVFLNTYTNLTHETTHAKRI